MFGQNVCVPNMYLAKISVAQMGIWPNSLWPKYMWLNCLYGPNVCLAQSSGVQMCRSHKLTKSGVVHILRLQVKVGGWFKIGKKCKLYTTKLQTFR